MKNVDSLLKAELEKLGVPVERLKYGGKAACFIVYQLVVGRDTFFSDDEEGAQEFTYQVHVYSKTPSVEVVQNIYANETSYAEQQRQAARQFRQIAREVMA